MGEEQPQSGAESAQAKHTGFGWLTWAFIIPLLYVLSSGPALGLASKGALPFRATKWIYAPLLICADACPPIGKFFYEYLDACGFHEMFDL